MAKREVLVGWKVTTKYLKSCVVWTEGLTKYKKGRWVQPKKGCGPLCVFNSMKAARSFKMQRYELVWQCFYTPSKETHVWEEGDLARRELQALPKGTVLADAVYLIEEILHG